MQKRFSDTVIDISFDFIAKEKFWRKPAQQNVFLKKKFNARQYKESVLWNKSQKRVNAQRGARTYDPEIKSLMLYRLS